MANKKKERREKKRKRKIHIQLSLKNVEKELQILQRKIENCSDEEKRDKLEQRVCQLINFTIPKLEQQLELAPKPF